MQIEAGQAVEGVCITLSNISKGIAFPSHQGLTNCHQGVTKCYNINNIYMEKFLHSDWLRAVQFFFLNSAEKS